MTTELLNDAGDGGAKADSGAELQVEVDSGAELQVEVASSVKVAVTWIPNHSFRFVPPNALASSSSLSFALQSGSANEPSSGDRCISGSVQHRVCSCLPKHQLGHSTLSPLALHTTTDLCALFFVLCRELPVVGADPTLRARGLNAL
jgi:hypothetical protein